ncbi:MAG: hypothetical protein ACKO6Q_04515 [Bacteroidota bacterium]
MNSPKPWEDFESYKRQLRLRRQEQEKRLADDWDSLRHSWKENGEWIRKQVKSISSGHTDNLIWGPVGRLLVDLIRSKLFRSNKS